MQGVISQSPVLRTLVVAVPGLALALFLGFLLGEGNAIVGVLILAIAVAFLLVMSLARRGVLEASMVAFLIIGYFAGNRGFAQLAIVRPVFVGELALAILGTLFVLKALLARELPNLRVPLAALISAYLLYALVRFSFDVRQYKFEAVRDLAVVYYAAFFFIAYQLGKKSTARAFIERYMTVAVVAHAVVAALFTFAPSVLQTNLVIKGAPLFFQKGDLTITFSAVCIFFVANRNRVFGLRWLRLSLLILLVTCAALGIARAAILALICVSVLLWISGQRRVFAYAAAGVAAALMTVMFITAAGNSVNDSEQVMLFKEKMASMFDFTGKYKYQTDLGTMKGGNNEFRRAFWKTMIEQTTRTNPIFGLGFGYDFLPQFESYYARGSWEGLRSPHNYFVTVYGRMGVVGLLIFGAIVVLMVRHAFVAAVMVRTRRMAATDFSYWCGALVLLISGTFGVVLEGPMGAIPFWVFLGLAFSSPILPPRETAPAVERPQFHKRQFPARRPELIRR
jgi:O-antigen ligase